MQIHRERYEMDEEADVEAEAGQWGNVPDCSWDYGPIIYTEEENETLARVWVDIGEDPVMVLNQTWDTMCRRIESLYNEERPEGVPEQLGKQLRCHRNRVTKEVELFEAYYQAAERK